ncbi:MAG: hypothetical protein GF364_05230 [Candidatus Lokiarchaeota archaeon]|nr:hypothetical protein [Candidatus Lokiarchaeota archaeon]
MSRQVVVEYEVFKEICRYSSQYASFKIPRQKWVECMGYLFCKVFKDEDKEYVVKEAVGMASGSEMRVEIPPEELAKIENMLRDRSGMFLGGWWHTHPGLTVFYSDTDIKNQMFYQQRNEEGLGIVFDLNMISDNFIGFKIYRNDSKDGKTYHEVPYQLKGFTEEKLKDALDYLGGITDTTIHNLSVNYEFKDDDLVEYQQGGIPKSSDPVADADTYFKKTKVNQFKKQFDKAIENIVIAANLYEQGNEYEMAIDSYLDAARYSIKSKKTYIADAMFDIARDIIDSNHIQARNYYLAKIFYNEGLIREVEENFTKAAMCMDEALKLYDHKEDFEDVYNAAIKRVVYLDRLGSPDLANDSRIIAKKALESIIKDASNNEYYSDKNWKQLLIDITEEIEQYNIKKKNEGLKRIA